MRAIKRQVPTFDLKKEFTIGWPLRDCPKFYIISRHKINPQVPHGLRGNFTFTFFPSESSGLSVCSSSRLFS